MSDGGRSERDFRPPDRFDDYRLLRSLGQGGMGQVWLAHDTVLDRPVAVKFIAAAEPDPEARKRLLIEARAAARVRHPNVMAVHRVGEIGQHPYIVTEYVAGQSLADMPLPLPWQRVLEIGLGLARGLAAAHRAGVLHRDIKLSNAVLAEDGTVKLLDFGVAKLVEAGTSRLREPSLAPLPLPRGDDDADRTVPARPSPAERTPGTPEPIRGGADLASGEETTALSTTAGHALVGTPAYLAPELWEGTAAAAQSDVYAMGCLLYGLCAGALPHHGAESIEEHRERVLTRTPRPLGPDVDARLAAVIQRCLARDPAARWASGEDLQAALEDLVPTAPPEAVEPVLAHLRGAGLAILDAAGGDPAGLSRARDVAAQVASWASARGLGDERVCEVRSVAPGAAPLAALEHALGEVAGAPVDLLLAPEEAGRALADALGAHRRVLVVLDPTEDLLARDAWTEALAMARSLPPLLDAVPAIGVLMVIDHPGLVRLAALPGWAARLQGSVVRV